jgi:DNA topoisomerase-1
MSKTLVVVESPSKVKKIQSYLGNDYLVTSSMGHFRSLDPKKMSVDIENNYNLEFINIPEKKDTIANIKKLYKTCSGGVLLASDGDYEGAAIAHHVFELLNVKPEYRMRIIFNEITQKAITESLKKKALIDMNEVHTQFGRMCLDKVLAYSICPLLWSEFGNFHLSCGRVMSPVIRLIIEREEEIAKFQSSSYYKLDANFLIDKQGLTNSKSNSNIIQTTCDEDIKEKPIIEKLYKDVSENKAKFTIKSLTKNNSTRSPPPPFITSSLQQAASISLGYSPDTTMKLSQKLYESSAITYMRSDSTVIAEDAMLNIKKQIETKFGEQYYKRTVYKSKNASAQNAHECIRPTNFTTESVLTYEGLTQQHDRLYKLILRRTLASQMMPATLEIRTVKISTGEKKKDQLVFSGKHEKVIFEGFLKAQNMHKGKSNKQKDNDEPENSSGEENETENKDNNNEDENDTNEEENENNEIKTANSEHNKYLETIFDKLKENQEVFTQSMSSNEKYSKPKHSRYTEASLVSAMEKLGIGRPSTYSSAVKKIQDKEYVERKSLPAKKVNLTSLYYNYPDIIKIETKEGKIEGDKNKLIVSSLGIMINQYLVKNFTQIMNYEFTSQVEALLDEIAEGKKEWTKVVDDVYKQITPIIDSLSKELKSRKVLKSADPTADSSSRRNLGVNPQNNLPIVCIKSKKGYLIVEENPVKKQSRFANFSSTFEDMNLEKALTLLVFPKNLGSYLEKDIIIKKAKNIYIQFGDANYSIENYMNANKQSTIDPESISLSEAKLIIDYYIKSKADKEENAKKDKVLNEDITIKTGPYGVYLKLTDNTNVKLPKKYKDNIDSLTLEDALAIVEKHKTTPSKGSKAGKFGPKGSAKPKPKSAEPKSAKPKEKAKPKSAEVKPKVKKEKAPKAVKVKPVKNKF